MHASSTRLIALAFAVLLVTAPVGSAMAVSDGYPASADDRRNRIAAERLSNLVDDRPPIERKAIAIATVRAIDAGTRNDSKERAISRLNGTLDDYRDGARVSTPRVFVNDTRALFELSSMAGGPNDTELEAASLLVYEADNETAATAIADARRALERARDTSRVRDPTERRDRDERDRGRWKDDGDRRDADGRDGDRRADRSGGRWDGSDHDPSRSERRRTERDGDSSYRDDRDQSYRNSRDRARIRAAEAHLRNAERALARANRIANSSDRNGKWDGTRWRVKSRAAAIPHLAAAWWQAQRSIDRLDRTSEPDVRILTRGDPARNGTTDQTREIVGTVYDPRAYELENATVTVGGDRTLVTSLNTTTAPGTNATFRVNVTLERRVTTVEVSVEDARERHRWFDRGRRGDRSDEWDWPDDEDRSKEWDWPDDEGEEDAFPWKRDDGQRDDRKRDGAESRNGEKWDHDRDRHSKRSGSPPETGRDVLYLDGDRLTDTFERQVVGTDPQDPDSDAATTDVDEAGNGIIDGEETFGSSTLPLFVQDRIGADPFTNDTDDDGLTDEFELTGLGLLFNDVGSSDFDGDGVPDAEEDPDNDTLTNAREQELGTDPLVNDTDDDGLTDDVEVDLGLDPLVADGDEDGLDDGSERRLGTDPANPDTDGDGVLDGNETYTVTRSDAEVGVTLDVTGEGDLTDAVSIDEDEGNVAFDNLTSAVSPVVELESTRNFSSASVTISYDGSQVPAGNESDLAVYTFNETVGTFQRLNSTIDPANDTVTAETPHFSTFVVFDVRNWEATFDTPLPSGRSTGGETQLIDDVFIIDTSGSMRGNDPQEFRKTAAKRFVGALIEGDRAGVVDFDSNARVTQPLTTDLDAVNASIDRLDASGGTNIGSGIAQANGEFDRRSNDSRGKIAILLSDGQTVNEGYALEQARAAADRNVTIYTIGFGNADRPLMRGIAEETGGEFHFVDDAADLPDVFSRVAENTTEVKDSDGDGLPDSVETAGIRSGTGAVYQTDPNDPDTDGDGLPDGVEAGRRVGDRHYTVESDPTVADTDGDEMPDADEYQQGTDPFDADSDGDGLLDPSDAKPLTVEERESFSGLEVARTLSLGAVLGEAGLPDGALSVKESKSPVYLVGWLIGSIAFPPFDFRDLLQNVASGQPVEAMLDLAGIVPLFGDITKGASKVAKYADEFAGSAKVAMKLFARAGLDRVPDAISGPFLRAAFGGEYARLINQGLLPSDVSRLLDNLDDGEALVDVRRATTVGDQVVYLVQGRLDHIEAKHVTGDEFGRYASFFPTGNTVSAISGRRTALELPSRMGADEVEPLVFEAIRNADSSNRIWNGKAIEYTYNPGRFGISKMKVRVYTAEADRGVAGRIATAFPEEGESVLRWNAGPFRWERTAP